MRGTRSGYLLGSVLLALLPSATNAFYLPGAAPHNYVQGDPVDVYVNALTPILAGSDNSKLVCVFYDVNI
jgi:transmembrane 9 superfamily protein 2/4